MRIGLLTGTFDPIHDGHMALAQAALRGQCDEVWLLVNAHPGHKRTQASYFHRQAMVRLAIADEDRLKLAADFLRIPPYDHTWQGFQTLMAAYPQHTFMFLVGMDTIIRLDSWKDVQSVVKNTSYTVAHRPGTDYHALDELRLRLGELGSQLKVTLLELERAQAISSTNIRRQLADSQPPVGLARPVYDYIHLHHLYGLRGIPGTAL